jgi:hypothetical protein
MRAVSADDSEHSSSRAVTRISGAAEFTRSAPGVYFTNDSLTGFFDDTDKLMSDRSIEPSVTTRDLEVRVANA